MLYYSLILKLIQMEEETVEATAYKMKRKKNEANRNFHRVKQQLLQISCLMTNLLVLTLANFILD